MRLIRVLLVLAVLFIIVCVGFVAATWKSEIARVARPDPASFDPEIAKHGAGASTFSDWWSYKVEAYEATPYNAALMTELLDVNRRLVEAKHLGPAARLGPTQSAVIFTSAPAPRTRRAASTACSSNGLMTLLTPSMPRRSSAIRSIADR